MFSLEIQMRKSCGVQCGDQEQSVCGDSKDISVTGSVKITLRLWILNFSGPSALKAQDENVPDTKPGHS